MTELLPSILTPRFLDELELRVARIVDARLDERGLTGVRRRWRTIAEASAELGCSPEALRIRIRRGHVQAVRQGSRLYVDLDAMTPT